MRYIILSLLLVLVAVSCNPTKYVPKGDTLLDENTININKEEITKSDLLPYVKQKPNKRIFGTRFYLGLYNLSNINKEKWPHTWLREIGEAPVIYDQSSTDKTEQQIKSYAASKGYFDGKVTDTVKTEDRKSKVTYNVDLKPAYTIRKVTYEIADSNIQKLCYFDSINCEIEKGRHYDVDVLQSEKSRFERFIRDRGFYGFSSDYIFFRVDSTVGNRQVDIYYVIKNETKVDPDNRVSYVPHSMYGVKNIYIYTDYSPKDALEKGEAYFKSLDTTNYKGYYFISSKKKPDIRNDLIIQALYLKPGSIYNVTNTEQTQSHLLGLKAYRLVNINYYESNVSKDSDNQLLWLNCNIQLTLFTPQSYKIELEGTNSSGFLGGALNLIYQHKNLFHGAELFSVKLKGAYEALKDTSRIQSIQEYGVETSLRLPKFLFPFLNTERFIKKYNPSTTILAAYNFQAMPLYIKTVATATFGYNWKAGFYQEHIVNPLQFNLVKLPPGSIDSAFAARIASSSLAASYTDVMIMGGGYSFIYNDQKIKKSRDYWFLRINAEASGNMISLLERLSGGKKTDGTYKILSLPFAQYIRTDLDLRYNYILNDVSSIVYRGFIGIGIPYGNSKAMPFEKQYFSGGANGIRAWQVRSLGPGSYNPGKTSLLNQTADIKIEANAEYRFKLFSILEGALFIDAGNIWNFNYDAARPGSQFLLNKFYKDIAVGTGTGFRFDFKFVIARVDIGMKLRDPLLTDGSKWIFMRQPYTRKDFSIVFGIGYPF